MKYLFGPVLSRRLGRSLGIDLIPHKVCSLDCLYCECGKTTDLTSKRQVFVDSRKVIKELDDFLKNNPELDYITFSGSGEPTLAQNINLIIEHIKKNYPAYSIAVLTNSTLLSDHQVRKDIISADLIIPSLDTSTEESFREINRPEGAIKLNNIIDGLKQFAREYNGKIWLEVFIIPGINDSYEELLKLKDIITQIKPHKVQLNTLDRPGTEENITKASFEHLKSIAGFFEPVTTEITSDVTPEKVNIKSAGDIKSIIINTIKRRPCTVDDLQKICNKSRTEILMCVYTLVDENIIESKKGGRGDFFILK
ncbi:MAG: radical SAM protein [bacterium]|nr:radical SAM protein [bacterium]